MDPSRKHSSSLPSKGNEYQYLLIRLCNYNVKLSYFNMINKKFYLSLRTKTKSATRRDGVNACTFIISWVINWKLGMTYHKLKKMQEQ